MRIFKFPLIIFVFFVPLTFFGQNQTSFYEHYTGLISTDLKLTADLIKLENNFSGFYYYEFKEEGLWRVSKPIALDGRVDEKHEFVLNEFGEGQSYFQGLQETSKLITRYWNNSQLKNAVDFTLKATYPGGTIPLHVTESHQIQYFNKDIKQPQAAFHISLLFPTSQLDEAVYHQLLQKIYYLIGIRGEVNAQTNIINNLQEAYFQQFQSALQNIKLDSFPDQFKWEKSIRMDVLNNEKSILCLQVETYAKTGLQDGTRVKKFLVFNTEQNKVVKLEDIFPTENQKKLNDLLLEKLKIQYRLSQDINLTDAGFFQDTLNPSANFYVHPGGLGFYYNVYEIAPFSNGPTDLFIPWSDLEAILSEDSMVKSLLR